MNTYPLLICQIVFAAALAWSCFCRLVKTNEDTVQEILLAIWFEGVVAMLVALAPVLPLISPEHIYWTALTTPEWIWLVLLIAVALVQVVATSKHWKHGVPTPFLKESA